MVDSRDVAAVAGVALTIESHDDQTTSCPVRRRSCMSTSPTSFLRLRAGESTLSPCPTKDRVRDSSRRFGCSFNTTSLGPTRTAR
jgi:hypothetical protein